MSVILSCLYITGVKWLRWKLTMFLCRSIHDELRPGDIIPDRPCVNWDIMPMALYKECCLGTHFTKFLAYMMCLGRFREDEARRYYERIRRQFGWSVPSILSLIWHRLLLVWYKENKKKNRKPKKEKSASVKRYKWIPTERERRLSVMSKKKKIKRDLLAAYKDPAASGSLPKPKGSQSERPKHYWKRTWVTPYTNRGDNVSRHSRSWPRDWIING